MSELIHLLLDLENVQPTAAQLTQVRGARYRLWAFHGPQQKHFTADRVNAWQPLGNQVRFVQSKKSGNNALDLHIAFCLGEASECDRWAGSTSHYIVVSRDNDFDALFGYLESHGVKLSRVPSLPEALKLAGDAVEESKKPAPRKATPQKPARKPTNMERAVKDFREHPKNRPRTEKKLRNHIASLLDLEVTDSEIGRVVQELKSLGLITMEGVSVKYSTAKLKL